MTGKSSESMQDKFISRIPRRYYASVLFIVFIIYSIYVILISLSPDLRNSDVSKQYLIMVESAIATAYLLGGNIFLLKKSKIIIDNLSYISGDKNKEIAKPLKKTQLLTVILFLFIIFGRETKDLRPYIDMGLAVFLFVIYNLFVGLIIIILLGSVLCIIINMYRSLSSFAENHEKNIGSIMPILLIDNKIETIKDCISQSIFYYFIGITLLILTYNNPVSQGKYEIFILAILFLLGLAFFFACLNSIKMIRNSRNEYEIEDINKLIQEKMLEASSIIKENDFAKMTQLSFISSGLDILRNQRDDLIKMDKKFYDLHTMGRLIGSVLLSLFGLLSKPAFELFLNDLIAEISQTAAIAVNALADVTNNAITILANHLLIATQISKLMI
jgi:hypothetical protein